MKAINLVLLFLVSSFASAAQKALKLNRTVAINEVADPAPLREAQRAMGIKSR